MLKKLFRSKARREKCCVNKTFRINYVADINPDKERQYLCDAQNKKEAVYGFWDNHNPSFIDIISVNKLN